MKINIKSVQSENKTAALNFISIIVLNGIAFLTAPIFNRTLGPEQYGHVTLFNTFVSVVSCIFGLGLYGAVGPGLYYFKEKYIEFRNSILLFGTIISIFLASICLLFISPISVLLKYSPLFIILILAHAVSNFVVNFVQNSYIFEKKPIQNFILSLSIALTTIALSLFLIHNANSEEKYIARISGLTIPHVIIAVLVFIMLYKSKPIGLVYEYSHYSLTIGIPTVFHLLSGLVLAASDRIMMKYMGIEGTEIGIYGAFYAFSAILSTILRALNSSWCPFYYDSLNKGDWNNTNKKCKNYIELFTVLACGFLLLSREVGMIYTGEEYYTGLSIIPILVIAIYFTFMYQFFVNYELYYKKAKIVAYGTAGTAMFNIMLNYLWIPKYGMYGASVATALSYFGLFIVHYIIATKLKPQGSKTKIIYFLPGLIAITASTFMFYLLRNMWYVRWTFGAIIGIYEIIRIKNRKNIF